MDKVFLKGLSLLETLVLSEEPRGVTDLANDLGLNKSNIHRLLQTLVHRGYVQKEAVTGRYQCTLKLWQLGAVLAERIEIKSIARPFILQLAHQTLETVHLSILEDLEVVYVEKIESPQPVGTYSRLGRRAPGYCTATGKALLAWLPDEALKPLEGRLEKFTDRTITDLETLRHELRRIREQGFAVNRGEWHDTVCGLGAPIFDASRKVCAAIGLSGPIHRLSPGVIRDFAPRVLEAASAISRAIGYPYAAIGKAARTAA